MNGNRPVLLVEDDQIDQMTTKRAFKSLNVTNELVIVENGIEALGYLRAPDNREPCLILLDLNMPKMGGIEFLKEMKKEEFLKRIPIVVLTTSDQEKDKIDSYDCSIAGYMVKPTDHMTFVGVIKSIDMYWTLCAAPPARS